MSKIRVVFASVNKWKKTIFTLKKIIISCVNYRTLHVKQPDVASGARPETKPLLREPNNYIKSASPLFSSFSVVPPVQFFSIIKKKNEKETTKLNPFDFNYSFNFKDEHYNNIPGIKGSVVYPFCYEVDHHTFRHIEFVSIW